MKKLNYSDIKEETLIDVRSQHDYQKGHIKGSLNFNPGNFKKYASHYLSSDQPIVFVVGDEEQANLEELYTLAEEMGFTQLIGYLSVNEVPNEFIQSTETISAKDFLANTDDYILVDLRNPEEITRPAPENNLITIPLEDLPNNYQSLDSDKDIYALCGSGNRATTAASYLSDKGFNPIVIEGGMKTVQEETLN